MKTLIQTLLAIAVTLAAASAKPIARGNVLEISIKGVPVEEQQDINGIYTVDESGRVRLPHLTSGVSASGVSPSSLAKRIEAAYRNAGIYTGPAINVINQETTREKTETRRFVTVGGQVRGAGSIPFQDGLTVYAAIQAAGGENEFGDMRKVKLMRGNRIQVYDMRVPANRLVRLRQNDIIEVPQKGIF